MSDQEQSAYRNLENASTTCVHCGGKYRHETWCATRRSIATYAWQAVADPAKLNPADALTLHLLGVRW